MRGIRAGGMLACLLAVSLTGCATTNGTPAAAYKTSAGTVTVPATATETATVTATVTAVPGASGDAGITRPQMPEVIGMTQAKATAELHVFGMQVEILTEPNADNPPGTVLDQVPRPGDTIAAGEVASLTLAADPGPAPVTSPDEIPPSS